jgi:dihydroorotate dehydrogenase (fumarate)
MGLNLKSPLMPGASPMVDNLDTGKRLEDAGAAAIVMHSLFVEQITRIKKSVDVPVIGSLNGTTPGGWVEYAKMIQQAGADALELNLYFVAADVQDHAEAIETRLLQIVRSVTEKLTIPLAVKLSPFFTSLANFASDLDAAGVDGLVLFNRFYQPDIDIERLEVKPTLHLSDASELLLRLRWLAILSPHISASLAVSGGVHGEFGAIQAIMAGADAVQIVSALLHYGPEHLAAIERGMIRWMQDNGYTTVRQMRGSMNSANCPDAQSFERANYLRALQSFNTRLPSGH